ncbi:MAG: hypothetical protein C0594_02985 [Marinilabiliales bacterium]|nr:MAG: hypothetical protein C0594_02985 [Marinilabiliales bacterium]
MRKIFTVFILSFLLSFSFAKAGVIKMDGIFQGKNLYVVNPFAASGVGFCVYEVTVNGQITTDEINSSAFEIDLSMFQLQLGDKLVVEIKHKDNCKPKVLNPEVLKPKSTYNLTSINVEKDGTLKWSTSGEAGKLPFIVEQFRWNKWVKVAEIEGKGTPTNNNYSTTVKPHSGENKFRVKQVDYTKKPRYSDEVTFRSMSPPVSLESKRVDDKLEFTMETMYEIYDYYGNIVKKGFGKDVDVSKLDKGKYFVNFDNTMEQITVK